MFLDNIDKFRGTGERNSLGQTLEEFLEEYDRKKYDCPSNTTDIIIFRAKTKPVSMESLKVLLIKRGNHPCIGMWSTPGGFVDLKENLIDGARRELEEETGVKGLPLQQLLTWNRYDLDPRWRVITTPFVSLIEEDIPVKAGDDAADALWFDLSIKEDQDIYSLTLENEENNLTLHARVEKKTSGHPVFPQVEYTDLDFDLLDGHHACLILQAYEYIKSRI